MVRSERLVVTFYREAEREATEFIAELSSSIAVNKKLEGQNMDDADRLFLQECTWRLRETMEDVLGWAKYCRQEANRLEKLLANDDRSA